MMIFLLDQEDKLNIGNRLNTAKSKLNEYHEKVKLIETDIPIIKERLSIFQHVYEYINRHEKRNQIINACNQPVAFAFTRDTLFYKEILLSDDKINTVNKKYEKYKNDLDYANKQLQVFKEGIEFLKKDIELLENIQNKDIHYGYFDDAGIKQY